MKDALPQRRSGCPIACALDLVGDRWTLVVLRDLIMVRKRHYQELLAGNEGIASNILASRLKLLEAAGLVTRRRDPTQARRVIYEPTEKALDLVPVMVELMQWGLKHVPRSAAPPPMLRRLAADRDGFIADIRAMHKRGGAPAATRNGRAARKSTPAQKR
jgi:DNA-binding HxlR family transcriptional regulator